MTQSEQSFAYAQRQYDLEHPPEPLNREEWLDLQADDADRREDIRNGDEV